MVVVVVIHITKAVNPKPLHGTRTYSTPSHVVIYITKAVNTLLLFLTFSALVANNPKKHSSIFLDIPKTYCELGVLNHDTLVRTCRYALKEKERTAAHDYKKYYSTRTQAPETRDYTLTPVHRREPYTFFRSM